jgi:hypothetical protein
MYLQSNSNIPTMYLQSNSNIPTMYLQSNSNFIVFYVRVTTPFSRKQQTFSVTLKKMSGVGRLYIYWEVYLLLKMKTLCGIN